MRIAPYMIGTALIISACASHSVKVEIPKEHSRNVAIPKELAQQALTYGKDFDGCRTSLGTLRSYPDPSQALKAYIGLERGNGSTRARISKFDDTVMFEGIKDDRKTEYIYFGISNGQMHWKAPYNGRQAAIIFPKSEKEQAELDIEGRKISGDFLAAFRECKNTR